jgi:xylan 1,4-beta-xylosidase
VAERPVRPGRVHLAVEAHGQAYQMRYAEEPGRWHDPGAPVDGRILSTPVAGGLTGACIGLYASANGHAGTNTADFDWFEYRGL